jgi:hypothetical protein
MSGAYVGLYCEQQTKFWPIPVGWRKMRETPIRIMSIGLSTNFFTLPCFLSWEVSSTSERESRLLFPLNPLRLGLKSCYVIPSLGYKVLLRSYTCNIVYLEYTFSGKNKSIVWFWSLKFFFRTWMVLIGCSSSSS